MLSSRSNELLEGQLRLLHMPIYKRGIVSIESDQGGLPTENNDDHHGADGTRRMMVLT